MAKELQRLWFLTECLINQPELLLIGLEGKRSDDDGGMDFRYAYACGGSC